MERDEARRADALDRYWDAVLRGETPDRPAEVGEPAAEVIARLVARPALPGLDVAHRRGRRDVLAQIEAEAKGNESRRQDTTALSISAPRVSPNGRIEPPSGRGLLPVLPARKERRRWASAQLATAALLILTLVCGYVAFGPLRPDNDAGQPAMVPALDATPAASPGPAATVDVLIEATAENLPVGGGEVTVQPFTLEPLPEEMGFHLTGGLILLGVTDGPLVVRVGNTEHRLEAGEQVIAPPGQRLALRAPGPKPAAGAAVLLGKFEMDLADYDPTAFKWHEPVYTTVGASPADPARVVLERLTLPPGTSLPAYEPRGLEWLGLEAGTLGLTLEGADLPFTFQDGEEETLRPGWKPFEPFAPGTRVTARNAGDVPLVLYRLTITPAGTGTPTAGIPTP